MFVKVAVSDLKPNPYRDLKRLPLDPEKVDSLYASIQATGFWDNLVGRKHDGHLQLAYGHHRLAALKKAKITEITLNVKSLSNEVMCKIMAAENMSEWRHDSATDVETVRSVIDAFDRGEIELPKVGNRSYLCTSTNRKYSVESVAQFLGKGWDNKVRAALEVINAEHEGAVDEKDLAGLSTRQAQAVVQQARRTVKETGNKVLAKEVGKRLANGMKKGSGGRYKGKDVADVTIHTAKRITDEWISPPKLKGKKEVPDVNGFAHELSLLALHFFANPNRKKFDSIVRYASSLTPERRRELRKSLQSVVDAASKYINELDAHPKDITPKKERGALTHA